MFFRFFLPKSRSIIGGPNKSFEKIYARAMVIWDRQESSCLYNHGPLVTLFAYKSSLQEVFLQKGVLKKCNKFSCRRTPMLKCNFSKAALQLYIKITLQHRCYLVIFPHFSVHHFIIIIFFLYLLVNIRSITCICI